MFRYRAPGKRVSGCSPVGGAPGLGVVPTPSAMVKVEAREALQHGRLREFAGLRNRSEKRP